MAAAEPRYALKSDEYCWTEKLQEVHHKVEDKIKTLIMLTSGHFLSFTRLGLVWPNLSWAWPAISSALYGQESRLS